MFIEIKQAFEKNYGIPPQRIFFCPGRINLMGEHLDYNGGYVLPCSISLGTYLAVSNRDDQEIHFHSLNLKECKIWKIQEKIEKKGNGWFNYPLGIIKYLAESKIPITGMNLLYGGNIPISSGLSSSASIEILTAYSLNEIFKMGYGKLDLVSLAKRVENEFIGLQSGIMDQFSVSFGKKNEAILLNCQTLDIEYVPIELETYSLVIIGTNKSRNLSESKYNERVRECETARLELEKHTPLNYLCDLNLSSFLQLNSPILDPIAAKRALHVVSENERVHLSVKALREGDLNQFGSLMYSSHVSLKNLYEVSGLELDTIIDYCHLDPSVLGARMTGAGFGGCAIALVESDSLDPFERGLMKYYQENVGYLPSVYISEIGNGVQELK